MGNNKKTTLVTAKTTPYAEMGRFTTTETVFDTAEDPAGSWHTVTYEHVRNIHCRECGQAMAFVEWETNFWRCPRCGVEN